MQLLDADCNCLLISTNERLYVSTVTVNYKIDERNGLLDLENESVEMHKYRHSRSDKCCLQRSTLVQPVIIAELAFYFSIQSTEENPPLYSYLVIGDEFWENLSNEGN